ncbi:MAG: hypothetical protein HY579_09400 [Nitrospinae bacterium]|nr:hypothetical protein [Nitrospinota bacterium]
MKTKNLTAIILAAALAFLGCAAVNEGLDTANEGAKEAGKPVGKVMKIPGSAAQGAAEGMIKKEKDPDNPFNR